MKFEHSSEKSILDQLSPVRDAFSRYIPYALGPSIVLFGLLVFASFRIPDYFTAQSTIFVQPQRVSSQVIEAPTQDEMRERMEALLQEILSRQRLKSIIEQFEIYQPHDNPRAMEIAIGRFRDAVSISQAKSPTGVALHQTFKLDFSHRNPETAFKVADAVANLLIEESIVGRRSDIQGTEEFLDAQLADARRKLEKTESQVQGFVRKNFDKLPEHLDAAVARLQNAQMQLASNSELITANMTRRENLTAEIADFKRQGGGLSSSIDPDSSGIDPFESLAQLESALVMLKSRYSDEHPDVKRTKARIGALKKRLSDPNASPADRKAARASAGTAAASSPVYRSLKRQLGDVDVQLASLREENERLKATTSKLQKNIQEMPLKEQELIKIKRDYANVQDNYERLLAARDEAALQSDLIRTQRGTQFRVVERAEKPQFPSGPNRVLLFTGSMGIALIFLLAVPILFFLLNSSFKTTDDIEQETSLDVLAVIPPMSTGESTLTRRRLYATSALASIVALVGGSFIIYVAI